MSAPQVNGTKAATVGMTDEPSWPITEYIQLVEQIQNLPPDQQQAAIDQFYHTHPKPQRRITLSRNTDASTSLDLKDSQGNNRLVLNIDHPVAVGKPRVPRRKPQTRHLCLGHRCLGHPHRALLLSAISSVALTGVGARFD